MGTFILAIIILIVFGIVFHTLCDFAEDQWDKDHGKGCLNVGCGIVTVIAVIGVIILMLGGMAKSCTSDYPSRDYYEAPRK